MVSTKQTDDVTMQMKCCAKACVLKFYSASLNFFPAKLHLKQGEINCKILKVDHAYGDLLLV